MSIVPLVRNKTVVTTDGDFDKAGGRKGKAVLIRNFDDRQLRDDNWKEANCSYDLRVGARYFDHRDDDATTLRTEKAIQLLPGGAVIIETEESVHFPEQLFGEIVPRVYWLQQGLSNTMSKVDPGYNGPLLVTLFNLGKRTVLLERKDPFCALVVHSVGPDCIPRDKEPKQITAEHGTRSLRRRIKDRLEANRGGWLLLSILVNIGVGSVALVWLIAHILRLVKR